MLVSILGWWGLKAMVEKSHSGLSAGLFIAYLLSVGLNLSCLWFALKKVLSLFKLCAAPTHSEFTSTLMSCLKPEILERGTPPNPMGKDGNVEGCIVLCNHVNWSDFVFGCGRQSAECVRLCRRILSTIRIIGRHPSDFVFEICRRSVHIVVGKFVIYKFQWTHCSLMPKRKEQIRARCR